MWLVTLGDTDTKHVQCYSRLLQGTRDSSVLWPLGTTPQSGYNISFVNLSGYLVYILVFRTFLVLSQFLVASIFLGRHASHHHFTWCLFISTLTAFLRTVCVCVCVLPPRMSQSRPLSSINFVLIPYLIIKARKSVCPALYLLNSFIFTTLGCRY